MDDFHIEAVQGPRQDAGFGLSHFALAVLFRRPRVVLVNPATAFTPYTPSVTHCYLVVSVLHLADSDMTGYNIGRCPRAG